MSLIGGGGGGASRLLSRIVRRNRLETNLPVEKKILISQS